MIIIIKRRFRGLEIPGGDWRGIFIPLAVRLKCTQNKMKTRSQNTYHIFRCLGKQGMLPPRESNQPGVQKCTIGSTTSLGKHSDSNHAQGGLPAGSCRVTPTRKKEKDKRQKWSREDYKEVTYAFYMSIKN